MSRRAPGTNSAGSPGSTRSTSRTSSSTGRRTRRRGRARARCRRRRSAVEHRHAVPHARAHAAARVGQLEIEKGASVATGAPLLARHREGRIDERARREVAHERATGHRGEYRRPWRPTPAAAPGALPGYPPRVSGQVPERVEIRPFHALHYAAERVRPRRRGDAAVRRHRRRSAPPAARSQPVQRRPPDPARSPARSARPATRSRPGAASSVVVREPRPCLYWLEQNARGPDGVRRRRAGLIAALRLEPYAPGRVRPPRAHDGRAQGGPAGGAARRARQPLADLHGLRRPVATHQRDLRSASSRRASRMLR